MSITVDPHTAGPMERLTWTVADWLSIGLEADTEPNQHGGLLSIGSFLHSNGLQIVDRRSPHVCTTIDLVRDADEQLLSIHAMRVASESYHGKTPDGTRTYELIHGDLHVSGTLGGWAVIGALLAAQPDLTPEQLAELSRPVH